MTDTDKGKVIDVPPERTEVLDLTTGGSGGVIDKGLTKEGLDSVLFLADHIEELAAAHEKIIIVALKRAQPGDWILHGEKANIGYAGALRIASLAGINFTNWRHRIIKWTDEAGEAYRHEYECDVTMGRRIMFAFGRYGSRDKFLGFKDGDWRPLEDINEGDIKTAAYHRCYAEGVKGILGLHSMDPEYLKKNGVDLKSARGVEYNSERKSAASAGETGQKKTAQGKIVSIDKKDGPLKDGKPSWVKWIITLDNKVHYSTFDKPVCDAAIAADEEGATVSIAFTVHEKYGAQIVELKKVAS